VRLLADLTDDVVEAANRTRQGCAQAETGRRCEHGLEQDAEPVIDNTSPRANGPRSASHPTQFRSVALASANDDNPISD
jgi:hypothetical protein